MNIVGQRRTDGGGGRASSVLVVYKGAPVALVGRRRFSFLGEMRHLPPGDPDVRVVTYMACYAQLVLAGEIPDYSDREAERFARLALIDPDELARLWSDSDHTLARHFAVPVEQVRQARHEFEDQNGR